MDTFSMGITVVVGCFRAKPCTHCSLLSYMETLPNNASSNPPLFQVGVDVAMKKSYFINALKLCLIDVGLNPALYGGHSFRSGSASSASLKGFSDWEIKLMGRWQSEVYRIYLRKPELIASYAQRLV